MESDKDIVELDEETYMISEGEGRGRTHSYLVIGENRACLIDTGFGYTNMKAAVERLTEKEVFVICTHGHLDHIGSNSYFDEIYLHPADRGLYELHSDPAYRLSFLKQRYLNKGMTREEVESEEFKERTRRLWHQKPANAIGSLEDGQTFQLGNRELTIVHTPGHTRGSVCILDAGRRRLYTGDTICELGVLLCFEESTPVETYLSSLETLWDMRGQYTEIFGGHQRIPLELSYLADYMECAKQAIARTDGETFLTCKKAALSLADRT